MDANQKSVRKVYGDAVPRMPAGEYAGRLITEVPQAYMQKCAENVANKSHTANWALIATEWQRRHDLILLGHYDVVAPPTRAEPMAPEPEPPTPAPPEPQTLKRMRVTLTSEVFHAVEKLSGKPFGKGNDRFSKKLVQLLERALENEPQCAP